MKKSKLSITLVTSFIAAMAMSACSSVSAKKDAIVSFTPYGSKESIALLTDDIYNQYKNTNSGVGKFYEKILEVLIRYEFKDKGFEDGEQNYSQIENWAKNEVQNKKDQAKANAKSNGTNYDDEWKSILESNDVEDANELREKFIYEKEKQVIKEWYADNIDATLRNEFLGVDTNGQKVTSNVKAAMPYHIRHILVKVDEAGNAEEKFYKGTISKEKAELLRDVAVELAEGKKSFSEIAKRSDDGSKDKGGDVGIMTNDASSGTLGMVNEFQLGLYAYDNIYDATNAADPAASVIKDGLGITQDVVDALPDDFAVVPYEAFVQIGKYADVTADKYGNQLANGSQTLYPRNILWNKYFNMHNVFLIKNAKLGGEKFGTATANKEFSELASATAYDTTGNLKGFNNDGYLTDGRGNVIIGVRSEYGIHFMVIEKSMYDYADLPVYYDTKVPGQDGYDPDADSYVNYVVSIDKTDYKTRADDVKNKITSFDSTYDYRLYKWFTSEEKYKDNISFEGAAEGLNKSIENYIDFLQATNATKQEEGLEKVWRTYNRLIDVQEDNRNAMFDTRDTKGNLQSNLTRLVSEKAADEFFALYDDPDTYSAYYADFAEGGIFYYYA